MKTRINSLSYPEQTLNGHVVDYYCSIVTVLLNTFTGTKAWVSGRTIGPSDYRTFGLSIQYRTNKTPYHFTAKHVEAQQKTARAHENDN